MRPWRNKGPDKLPGGKGRAEDIGMATRPGTEREPRWVGVSGEPGLAAQASGQACCLLLPLSEERLVPVFILCLQMYKKKREAWVWLGEG